MSFVLIHWTSVLRESKWKLKYGSPLIKIQMVISPTTTNFDSQTVPYLKGKSPEDVKKAAAVEQPSHAQMVTVVTNFLDDLINSGTETATGDTSNTEVKKTVKEVAGDLARHLFTVKELLVQDGSAIKKADGSTLFLAKAESNLNNSVNNLAEQTLASIHTKLSAYGIKVNDEEAAQLKKVIIEELKKPPKPKSAADTTASAASTAATTTTSTAATADTAAPTATPSTTTSTSLENPIIFLINFLKEKQSELTKGLLGSNSIVTFLNQQADEKTGQASGISQLRELNQKIKETGKDWDKNLDTVTGALESFDANLAENKKFIETHLGKDNFIEELVKLVKLDENRQVQVGILLKNLEITIDEKTMVNLTGKITGQLGEKAKESLRTELGDLIEQQNQSKKLANPFALNLNGANEYLEKYNGALKEIKNKNLPTQQEIQEKQQATANFLESIKEGLDNNQLSIEDVKVINKSLGLTEEQRKSGKASPAIDNMCGRFIDSMKEKGKELGIEITEEGLKQFAGTAVVLAIGAALFCPNLVGNLTKGAFSLGAMITQTVLPLYQNITQANLTKTLAESANK